MCQTPSIHAARFYTTGHCSSRTERPMIQTVSRLSRSMKRGPLCSRKSRSATSSSNSLMSHADESPNFAAISSPRPSTRTSHNSATSSAAHR